MIRPSERDGSQAMKRGETDRIRGGTAASPLDEVLVRQQRDGGQRAADPLDRVLDGDHAAVADALAAHPERLVQHEVDLLLGLGPGRHAVELHDDAILRRVVGDCVADGGGHRLAGRLAGDGGIGRRDQRAGLDLGELDHRHFGGEDAGHLDEVDVADAGREQRVVEGIEGGAAFRATRGRRRHRHLLRHSLLLLTAGISPPITVPPPGRREILSSLYWPVERTQEKSDATAPRCSVPPPSAARRLAPTERDAKRGGRLLGSADSAWRRHEARRSSGACDAVWKWRRDAFFLAKGVYGPYSETDFAGGEKFFAVGTAMRTGASQERCGRWPDRTKEGQWIERAGAAPAARVVRLRLGRHQQP